MMGEEDRNSEEEDGKMILDGDNEKLCGQGYERKRWKRRGNLEGGRWDDCNRSTVDNRNV
jgi:hypothetical protein